MAAGRLRAGGRLALGARLEVSRDRGVKRQEMIGKLFGHTQVQTTARYAHLAIDPVKSTREPHREQDGRNRGLIFNAA